MYSTLLALHSIVRWLVLISLLYAMYRAYMGWRREQVFRPTDNKVRHWTATFAHIQMTIGLILYFVSPLIQGFLQNFKESVAVGEIRFYGMEHSFTMLIAVICITIGSSKAKRMSTDKGKFKTMAIWFTIGLILILISIPWPFSPMSARPYFRPFAF